MRNKNCLMITQSRDNTASYLLDILAPYIKVCRLNVDELQRYEIDFTNEGFTMRDGEGILLESDDVYSVYYRKIAFPDLSMYEAQFHSLMQREIMSLVEGIAETLGQRCLTRPSILKRAENKIVQLKLAGQIGFNQASSLITNSDKQANKFIKMQDSIVKPLATGKIKSEVGWGIIQTNQVPKNERVEGLVLSPAYFQSYISKPDGEYRITIVDRTVHAVRIDSSNEVDWRRHGAVNKYHVVEMPKSVVGKCFEMMDELNITFGAFDFIKYKDEYIFLEVNPNGQWLWLEKKLGLNIAKSIVNYLCGRMYL